MNAQSDKLSLETSVTGTVSLEANQKGINMSRIMRVFYQFEQRVFTPELLESILLAYKQELQAYRAQLRLDFEYPILKTSLRSGLQGWQYYKAAYEGKIDELDRFRKFLHFDFIYSSACPCSSELSEHARDQRLFMDSVFATQYGSRQCGSAEGAHLNIEALQALCLQALQMKRLWLSVRMNRLCRMNGAHMKFVEDASLVVCRARCGVAIVTFRSPVPISVFTLMMRWLLLKGVPGALLVNLTTSKNSILRR